MQVQREEKSEMSPQSAGSYTDEEGGGSGTSKGTPFTQDIGDFVVPATVLLGKRQRGVRISSRKEMEKILSGVSLRGEGDWWIMGDP